MKIDYYCWTEKSLGISDWALAEYDDENMRWVKTQELKQIEKAQKQDKFIVFDRTTKCFYKNGKEIDIKDKVVFPRAFTYYEKELMTELERAGAKSLQTIEDYEKIINWPLMIQPEHRRVKETTYGDFAENYKQYRKEFGRRIFFKTVEKTSKTTIIKSLKIYKNLIMVNPRVLVNRKEKIIISKVFKNIPDFKNKMFKHEYRCIVLDGKISTLSRSYIDYPTKVPKEVCDFAKFIVEKIDKTAKFPKNYVIDLGQVRQGLKKYVDIIEFNPITCSGLEIGNSFVNVDSISNDDCNREEINEENNND